MQVHLCFPVAVAVPLQLQHSPGISLLLALLLCSQTGCLGLPSVLLSPSSPTPYQPVTATSVENGEPGAELRSVYVCPPASPAASGQRLHQPALTRAVEGGESRGRHQGWRKRWHGGVWRQWYLQVYFIKTYFGGRISPLVHKEISCWGMRWRCSFCY